ncbi:MAG: hypothetical protein HFE49_08710 [Clostridia bacterium]|nr:hypothetical protein [Clostridia bacterium]
MKKSDLKKIIVIGAAVTAAAAATAIAVSKYRKHQESVREEELALANKHAYITGGGLSALASALYLIRDCGFTPSHVHIFTGGEYMRGNEKTGYICRRGKIISSINSMNFFELMSDVNSIDIPDLTVADEILNIYRANPSMRNITFIDDDSNVIDISQIKLEKEHRKAVLSLMQLKKEKLQSISLCDALPHDFFETHFWKLFRTAYDFSADSNAFEFISCISYINDILSGTLPGDFDRHEEIIEPLRAHLIKCNADLKENASVTDIDFNNGKAEAIHFTDRNIRKTVYLNEGDICIFPTDEMAQCEAFGSFNECVPKTFSSPYELWEKLSQKHPAFKDPSVFFDEFDGDMSVEFTVTLSNSLLPELIDKVTCGALGTDGVILLDNSSWKLTVCAVPQTHFKNQDDDTVLLWGTASRFDCDGEYCEKPMTECSGSEILYELISCFNLAEAWDDIRKTVINVIPCHRKYDKSYLSPVASKLEIIPTGIDNMAVSGDFADSDNSTVFAEEYAVTTARNAAYRLMNNRKKVYQAKPSSCAYIKKLLKSLVR